MTEEQRDHVVRISGPASDDLDALEPPEHPADELTAEGEFTPLTAEAAFAHVLHAGKAITGGARPPDAEAELLDSGPGATEPSSSWREVEALRKEINGLVAQVAARTGRKHAEVHVDLRRAVPGPRTASASIEVLLARRDHLLSDVR